MSVLVLLFLAAQYQTVDGKLLPDPVATPGAIITSSRSVICAPGYSLRMRKTVRTAVLKSAVRAYGVPWEPKKREADHRISLELGGSPNNVRNIWPEPYPDARDKDQYENQLHDLACSGKISVTEAQRRILQWNEPAGRP